MSPAVTEEFSRYLESITPPQQSCSQYGSALGHWWVGGCALSLFETKTKNEVEF